MDYEKEYEKLNAGTEAWKPDIGMHKVLLVSEAEKCEYVNEEKGTTTPQIKLLVSVGSEDKTWFISLGSTSQSLYGQLMAFGKLKGKLKDELITLLVNKTKNKAGESRNSYVIQEAIEAIKSFGEPTAEVIK